MRGLWFCSWIALVSPLAGYAVDWASLPQTPNPSGRATLLESYTLSATDIATLNPGIDLGSPADAAKNGYAKRDNPGIGSALVAVPGEPGKFYFLTDRGPNFDNAVREDKSYGKVFPLPNFTPAIVKAKLANGRIDIEQAIPLTNDKGQSVTGLPNNREDEMPFVALGGSALPYQPGGLDTEALQVLPDGRFLIAEEYGPSLLVADATGRVLVRYVPAGRDTRNAGYPVKDILPAIFKERRANRGFENLALSADRKTAWAVLQSPMGDTKARRFAESRVVRALRLDVSDPLQIRVTGMFAVMQSARVDYPDTGKQADLKYSDAVVVGENRLLLLERANNRVKLVLADFADATDLIATHFAVSLDLEDTYAKPEKVTMAKTQIVFDSREVGAIDSDKLEGLAVLSSSVVALVNDNDFGVGENTNNYPTRVWLLRLGKSLDIANDGVVSTQH